SGATSVRVLVLSEQMRSVLREFDVENGVTVRDLAVPQTMAASNLALSADAQRLAAPLFLRSHVLLGELLLNAESMKPDEVAIWDVAAARIVVQTNEADSSRIKLSASGRCLLSGTRTLQFA